MTFDGNLDILQSEILKYVCASKRCGENRLFLNVEETHTCICISKFLKFSYSAKQELKDLQTMNNDAQFARDTARSELGQLERRVYEERKKREMELLEVRKEAEEKRLQHERIEKRIVSLAT